MLPPSPPPPPDYDDDGEVTTGEVDTVVGPAGTDFLEVLRALVRKGSGPFFFVPEAVDAPPAVSAALCRTRDALHLLGVEWYWLVKPFVFGWLPPSRQGYEPHTIPVMDKLLGTTSGAEAGRLFLVTGDDDGALLAFAVQVAKQAKEEDVFSGGIALAKVGSDGTVISLHDVLEC